jgi:hypothetical protein
MSLRKSSLWPWFLVMLFAAAGFLVRLYLDSKFERLVPKNAGIEMGFLDSFMMEASRGVAAEEDHDE